MSKKKITKYLTHEQIMGLVNKIENRRVVIMTLLLYYTGLRASEFVGLRFCDIDNPPGYLFVAKGKGDKERLVPIIPGARKLLDEYIENYRQADPVSLEENIFLSWKTRNPLTRNGLWFILKSMNIHPHDLRHSFVVSLMNKNVSITVIQSVVGHSSITTTIDVYGKIFTDTMKNAVFAAELDKP